MPDVNVLVAAHRTDAPQHQVARAWLEDTLTRGIAVGLSEAVTTGFVRVVTHPRIFLDPTPLAEALEQCDRLYRADRVVQVAPGKSHWSLFVRLCEEADARGNLVADAAHAATALEAGATWMSFDHDFARFPGLSWRPPEAPAS